jgi:DNA-binding NtrC family response regulator
MSGTTNGAAADPGLTSERVRELLERVAPNDVGVVLEGDAGTDPALAAARLHALSPRARGPFVRVLCAGRAALELESELFGRDGRLEQADGGTLYLDELAELPLAAQNRLQRFLDRREFERAGGRETVRLDVRLVAATRRDLRGEIAAGRFLAGLLDRLEVVHLPPPAPAGEEAEGLRIPGATLAEIERVAILRTLEAVGGSTSRAASVLGISTRKIQYRLREYREEGMQRARPRTPFDRVG